MFVIGNFLEGVAWVLGIILNLYIWVVIIRALISWVSPDPYNPVVQILYRLTEPVLEPLRRHIPATGMGVDLSPLVAILAIYFLQYFLVGSLRDLAIRLQ